MAVQSGQSSTFEPVSSVSVLGFDIVAMLSDLVFVQLNASNRHNKYSPGICSSKGDHSTECLEGFWDPLVSGTLQK